MTYFTKSRPRRFFIALFICVVALFVLAYAWGFYNNLANPNAFCNEGGVGPCSPFQAGNSMIGLFIFITVLSLGTPIIIPTLIIWGIFEFVISYRKNGNNQNITSQ